MLFRSQDVVVARVHVVLPEKVAPGEPVQPPSAAVFIKHLSTLDPDAIGFRVKQLVARSIPGMGAPAQDRVSVVFVPAQVMPQRAVPDSSTAAWWWWALAAVLLCGAGATAWVRRNELRGLPARLSAVLARARTAARAPS